MKKQKIDFELQKLLEFHKKCSGIMEVLHKCGDVRPLV